MRSVEVDLEIKANAKDIIKAFIDQRMLNEWWSVERSLINNQPGEIYTLIWDISDKGFGYVSTGIISKYEVDKELEIGNLIYLNKEKPILGPMTLSVKTEQKGELSYVKLCQSGYQYGETWDWYYEAVKTA